MLGLFYFKKFSKMLFTASLSFLLFLSLFLFVNATQNPTVSAKAGFDGMVKNGNWNPFTFTIKSFEQFTGQISISGLSSDGQRYLYSADVDLKPNDFKDYIVYAPISNFTKSVKYTLTKDNKEILNGTVDFRKVIGFEVFTIGILSDKEHDLGSLSSIKNKDINPLYSTVDPTLIPYSSSLKFRFYNTQMNPPFGVADPFRQRYLAAEQKIEIINIDDVRLLGDYKSLNIFNSIIIDGYDTNKLDKYTKDSLVKWTENNILILNSSLSNAKTFDGLPEELKIFKTQETKDIPFPKSFQKFGNIKNLPNINISVYSPLVGKTIFEENGIPLISIHSFRKTGFIVNSAFSFAMEPFVNWMGKMELLKEMLKQVFDTEIDIQNGNFDVNSVYQRGLSIIGQNALNVPDTRLPPITKIFIVFALYILIVSPILYLVLKFFDKKEWAWLFIPALSILFIIAIYIMGFGTKYSKPILNTTTMIELEPEKNLQRVTSSTAVFNNSMGTLSIEYPRDMNLESNWNNGDAFSYKGAYMPSGYAGSSAYNMAMMPPISGMNYTDTQYPGFSPYSTNISRKLIYADTMRQEFYYTPLWSPQVLTTYKTAPLNGEFIVKSYFEQENIHFKVFNKTGYSFDDCYISVGNNIFELGDLNNGEEKEFTDKFQKFSTFDIPSVVSKFLEARYGNDIIAKLNDQAKARELTRKKYLLQNILNGLLQLPDLSNAHKPIRLIATKRNDTVYNIKVNEQSPESFNTDIYTQSSNFRFDKDSTVFLSNHVLIPTAYSSELTPFGLENGRLKIHSDVGVVNLDYILPPNVSYNKLKINLLKTVESFKNPLPENQYSDWQIKEKLSTRKAMSSQGSTEFMKDYPTEQLQPEPQKFSNDKKSISISILNYKTNKWEVIDNSFEESTNTMYYTKTAMSNIPDLIKLKITVNNDTQFGIGHFLEFPEFEISGVAK